MLTPIAVTMLGAAGYDDIRSCEPAVPILLAIGWGVTLGGAGSPLGGAMNITAIAILEEYTGQEFMYIDWVIRLLPYLIIAASVLLAGMLMIPMKVKNLEGTKEFFQRNYREFGPVKRDEKICLTLFIIAITGAFARPLFADILPGLTPAYIFLSFGFISFFITAADKGPLLTWKTAQNGTLWGMMILFAGGLAMGKLINGSGASTCLAEIVSKMSLDNSLIIIIFFVILARILSEVTNGTSSAAVCVPIIFEFTTKLGLNPIPYWFITTMAFNGEYLLPISVRAIPIAYGLDAEKMLKYGVPMTIINMVVVIIFGYVAINMWPTFSTLPYIGN
jgi:sodium-dependent dicarboxylate transporter 2/3/5